VVVAKPTFRAPGILPYQTMPAYPTLPGYPSYYQPAPPPVAPPPFVPPMPGPGHHGPMTLDHFARCFQPTPGTHHVCLIHPVTCQPVKVCFTLPAGCGHPKVCVHKRSIEFDYGRKEVEITFLRNGSVDVDY
jgi:hypothetical protein